MEMSENQSGNLLGRFNRTEQITIAISFVLLIGLFAFGGSFLYAESQIFQQETAIEISGAGEVGGDVTLIRADYENLPQSDRDVVDEVMRDGSATAYHSDVVTNNLDRGVQDGSVIQQGARVMWDSWDGDTSTMAVGDDTADVVIMVENTPNGDFAIELNSVTYMSPDVYETYSTPSNILFVGSVIFIFLSIIFAFIYLPNLMRRSDDIVDDSDDGDRYVSGDDR